MCSATRLVRSCVDMANTVRGKCPEDIRVLRMAAMVHAIISLVPTLQQRVLSRKRFPVGTSRRAYAENISDFRLVESTGAGGQNGPFFVNISFGRWPNVVNNMAMRGAGKGMGEANAGPLDHKRLQ